MIRRRLCLLFLLTGMTLFAYSQGLLFQANDKEIKERTSLQIFQEGDDTLFYEKLSVELLNFYSSILILFGLCFLLLEGRIEGENLIGKLLTY